MYTILNVIQCDPGVLGGTRSGRRNGPDASEILLQGDPKKLIERNMIFAKLLEFFLSVRSSKLRQETKI